MDYYGMKRKQLQSLCKQHGIPANSANSVLADSLSQLLDEKQKPTTRQRTCLKSPIETPVEGQPAVSKREAKKVRFSPNNELLEYELRSGKKQKDVVIERKTRRKSAANKVDKQVVNDNDNVDELIDDGAEKPVRLTRSRLQESGKGSLILNNKKKQGKKAAKDVEKVNDEGKEPGGNLGKITRSKVHTMNDGAFVQHDESKQIKRVEKDVKKTNESVEVGRLRVTRSKAQSGSDVNPEVKKSSGRRVKKDEHTVEASKMITDIPVRVTRTRGQISNEDIGNMDINSQGVNKRTRKEMKSTDNQELNKRKSLRTRGAEIVEKDELEKLGHGKQKRSKESVAEVPISQHRADKGSRQSRRNAVKVEDTEVSNQNVSKVEIVNDIKVTRSKRQREAELVQQAEEPSDHGEKKVVNRRKSVMQNSRGKGIDKPLVGKDTSENEIKAVVNPAGSPKSRERRGTPIVEDHTVKTKHVSTVSESPRHSAVSSSKSGGKSVAKKQLESSLKTPASRKNNQLAVQNAFPEVKDNSSRKRAKLSGTSQRYSDNRSEKSSVKGAPVSNFELDEEVTETESTPVIESHRRVTRSAIKTVEKEPSQSAFQDQPIVDAQFSSRKVPRFRPNSAVNTAPGRVTRSGIKHRGKEAIVFSDNVDKKKKPKSVPRKQTLGDTQISSPEGAEVGLNSDVDIIGVQSAISKASESENLPTVVPEENVVSLTGTTTVMENLSPVSVEKASGIESHTISDIKMTPVIMAEKPEDETTPDAVSDGSHVQNETLEVSVKTAISSETEDQVALNLEKIVADENVMDLTKLGSTSKVQQIDLMTEEPAISVDKTVVMEENEAGSFACHLSVEQPDVNGKSKEIEDQGEPSKIENVTQSIEDDGSYAQIAKESEHYDLNGKDLLQNDSVDEHEATDNGKGDDEDENVSVQKPSMNEPVSEDRDVADGVYAQMVDESDNKENIITTGQSVNEHVELATDEVVINCLAMESSGVEIEVVPSTNNDVHEEPILDNVAHGVDAQTVDGSDNKENIITTGQSVNEHGELATNEIVINSLAMDSSGAEFEVVPSTNNDVHEVPILGKSDGEDGVNVTKEGEIESVSLTDGNMLEDSLLAGNEEDNRSANATECQIELLPSSSGNKLEDSFLGCNDREDGSVNAMDCQIDSLPSSRGNMIDDHVPSCDIYDDVEADGDTYVPKELETGLEPANVPVSINDDSFDFENNQLQSNDSHAMDDPNVGGEDSEPAPNENTRVVTEASIIYHDQEQERAFNVSADEVPCDMVGFGASVEPSESPANIAAPHTHATAAIIAPLEESIHDINTEAVSNILTDSYDTHTENDSGNEQKFSNLDEDVQQKENETSPPEMNKEQTSEIVETTSAEDIALDDQEDHTVATVPSELDGGKFMEDCSKYGVEEFDSELEKTIDDDENPTREENSPILQTKEDLSQVMGNIGAHESPITKGTSPITYTHEESPLDDRDSDLHDLFKEDDKNKQGSTSVDWGDYTIEMDEFHDSVIANESDDVPDRSRKELQTSVLASSSCEESFRIAADMRMASGNVANENSSQKVDMLKENVVADMTEEVFNWSDSSQWQMESLGGFDGETQATATTDTSENKTYGSIEDYSHKLFGDEMDNSSDDGLKDNPISDGLENKEVKPEEFKDLGFDKGI